MSRKIGKIVNLLGGVGVGLTAASVAEIVPVVLRLSALGEAGGVFGALGRVLTGSSYFALWSVATLMWVFSAYYAYRLLVKIS